MTMNLNRAIELVVADQRESHPDLTAAEAIQHVLNTVCPEPDGDDELTDAYRAVLGNDAALTCQWYAMCTNPAVGEVAHPVLGKVPTCARCAAKHNMTFEVGCTNTATHAAHEVWGYSEDGGKMVPVGDCPGISDPFAGIPEDERF